MKRVLCIASFAILMLLSIAPPVRAQDPPKALIFIRGGSVDWEYMLNREVGVMYRVLQEAGIEVDVATASGDPISVGSVNYTPDLKLSDADLSEYATVILPCMAANRYVDPGALRMVGEAAAAGILVAAQYNSVYTLAEAGLLKDRKYAHAAEIDVDRFPGFEGAEFAGSSIVRDGNVITSGICPYMARQRGVPDQTEEFMQAVIEVIKG